MSKSSLLRPSVSRQSSNFLASASFAGGIGEDRDDEVVGDTGDGTWSRSLTPLGTSEALDSLNFHEPSAERSAMRMPWPGV